MNLPDKTAPSLYLQKKEKTMPAYDTVTEALKDLKARGFTTDFNIAFDKLQCSRTRRCLSPEEFEIVEHHRFEGASDPDDLSVLYAIEANDGTRGAVADAFGPYADPDLGAFLKTVKMREDL